ncbi:MAG: aminopeptidase P family protein [Treponema sp.]|jgi:Xaa-Pro aminopeptidase|nr:aminopeptidase P family protein [Treponema sp.]
MTNRELRYIQEAIRAEALDGWLFCNFHHRDMLSDTILHIARGSANSRTWVYAVPARGEPLKIVHTIEAEILAELPGSQRIYLSREDFIVALRALAHKVWGVHSSETLPSISYLDAGTAGAFEKAGLILGSAGGLIQRFKSLLDGRGMETHEKAAHALYEIVGIAWERVKKGYKDRETLYEGDIRDVMLGELERRSLVTDHPPIVGAGVNSGNPHYDFSGSGAALKEGDPLQFDIWAKENQENAVYADISWAGVFGASPSPHIEQVFADLVKVREETYRFIETELEAGRSLSGNQVDIKARELLIRLGYGSEIKHRTGHGIDTECHGSGVNMDSVEFPDSRLLLEGSCFSLEPGVYFSDFGLRTEIDVYILNGRPVVSGKERQFALLVCR